MGPMGVIGVRGESGDIGDIGEPELEPSWGGVWTGDMVW